MQVNFSDNTTNHIDGVIPPCEKKR